MTLSRFQDVQPRRWLRLVVVGHEHVERDAQGRQYQERDRCISPFVVSTHSNN